MNSAKALARHANTVIFSRRRVETGGIRLIISRHYRTSRDAVVNYPYSQQHQHRHEEEEVVRESFGEGHEDSAVGGGEGVDDDHTHERLELTEEEQAELPSHGFKNEHFVALSPIQKAVIGVGSGLASFFDPTKAGFCG
jgi:hypothetical protein